MMMMTVMVTVMVILSLRGNNRSGKHDQGNNCEQRVTKLHEYFLSHQRYPPGSRGVAMQHIGKPVPANKVIAISLRMFLV